MKLRFYPDLEFVVICQLPNTGAKSFIDSFFCSIVGYRPSHLLTNHATARSSGSSPKGNIKGNSAKTKKKVCTPKYFLTWIFIQHQCSLRCTTYPLFFFWAFFFWAFFFLIAEEPCNGVLVNWSGWPISLTGKLDPQRVAKPTKASFSHCRILLSKSFTNKFKR